MSCFLPATRAQTARWHLVSGFTAERIAAKATPPGGVEITCDLARSARRQGEFLWQLIDPMCQKQHVLVRAAERFTVLLGQVWYRHQVGPPL